MNYKYLKIVKDFQMLSNQFVISINDFLIFINQFLIFINACIYKCRKVIHEY